MVLLERTIKKILSFHRPPWAGTFSTGPGFSPAWPWCHTHCSHAHPSPSQSSLWPFPAGDPEPPSPWNSPIPLGAQESLAGVQIPQLPHLSNPSSCQFCLCWKEKKDLAASLGQIASLRYKTTHRVVFSLSHHNQHIKRIPLPERASQ